jgi:transcription-repair coupling factor (superfamily II helicase)
MENFRHHLKNRIEHLDEKQDTFLQGALWAFALLTSDAIPEHYCKDFEYKMSVVKCENQCQDCENTEQLSQEF